MALKLKIGSPVAGEDFFGRNAELRKAEMLIEDNNLMLAAPRRVGKTQTGVSSSARGRQTVNTGEFFTGINEIQVETTPIKLALPRHPNGPNRDKHSPAL